jgi:hypothetical protein
MFDFTAENSRNEADFPKLFTGEFPVFSGPFDLVNRSGRNGTGLPDRFQRWFAVKKTTNRKAEVKWSSEVSQACQPKAIGSFHI